MKQESMNQKSTNHPYKDKEAELLADATPSTFVDLLQRSYDLGYKDGVAVFAKAVLLLMEKGPEHEQIAKLLSGRN